MILIFMFTLLSLSRMNEPTIGFYNAEYHRSHIKEGFEHVQDFYDLVEFLKRDVGGFFYGKGSHLRVDDYENDGTMILLERGWQDTLVVGQACII